MEFRVLGGENWKRRLEGVRGARSARLRNSVHLVITLNSLLLNHTSLHIST